MKPKRKKGKNWKSLLEKSVLLEKIEVTKNEQ